MGTVGPVKDTVGGGGYGKGQYRLELLEKATGEECSPSAQEAGEVRWSWQVTDSDKGISCRICGCRVCGCRKCFSQVHWRNLHWGLLETNVLIVWAPGVLQDTNSWSQMEYSAEFAVAFYSLQSDLRAWVPLCFKALYMKQSELQAEVSRAAQ